MFLPRIFILIAFFLLPSFFVYHIPIAHAVFFNKDALYKKYDFKYLSAEAVEPVGEVIHGRAVVQSFFPRGRVVGVSLLMATYARINSSSVNVVFKKNGLTISEDNLRASALTDNAFVYFDIDSVVFKEGDVFEIVVNSDAEYKNDSITIWTGKCSNKISEPVLSYGDDKLESCLVGKIFMS